MLLQHCIVKPVQLACRKTSSLCSALCKASILGLKHAPSIHVLAWKLLWHAADDSIGGESIGEEVPLIDTGLPKSDEYDMELGRSPSFRKRKRSKLGLLPLVALIFYEVSGGPFGTEVCFTSSPTSNCLLLICALSRDCQRGWVHDAGTSLPPLQCWGVCEPMAIAQSELQYMLTTLHSARCCPELLHAAGPSMQWHLR